MYKLHNKEFLIVKDGDTLDIGGKTLKFFETPYLHTEETMITYCLKIKYYILATSLALMQQPMNYSMI